jgi:hypothetical protein
MMKKVNAILLILLFSLTTNLSGGHFPDTVFDSKVKSPKEFFGFEAGEVPLNHAQILGYFQYLNDNSQRTSLFYTGTTHEGRKLLLMFVGSAENIANLNAIQQQWQQLAAGAASGTETTPGLAWMMYNIHGDEMSGADAAVRLAYYLAAGSNPEIDTILDQTVVAIDPIENPDGRDRYLAAMQQWQSQIENDDVQSLHHSGLWPGGRGNHYLFDLNRDWFILSQPESRARMKMLTQYHPHLVVDAHEMGPTDTYLFKPSARTVQSLYSCPSQKMVGDLCPGPGQTLRSLWLELLHRGMVRRVVPRVRQLNNVLWRDYFHSLRTGQRRWHQHQAP